MYFYTELNLHHKTAVSSSSLNLFSIWHNILSQRVFYLFFYLMKKLVHNKWFLLTILSLTWGSSFILIKKSLFTFSPYEIGSLRLLIAGILLSFIGIPTLRKLDRKSIIYIGITGLCGSVIPLFLFPIAQTHISSSLAGVLDSLVPIFVLLIGFIFYNLKPKISQVFGVILSFFGATTLIFFNDSKDRKSTRLNS